MELCNGMDERTLVASRTERVTSAQIHEKHKGGGYGENREK